MPVEAPEGTAALGGRGGARLARHCWWTGTSSTSGVHAHAPEHPLVSPQVALDGGVATRVKDLPGLDPEDLGWSHLEQLTGLCGGCMGSSSDRIQMHPFNFRMRARIFSMIFSIGRPSRRYSIYERRFTEWAAPNSRATLDVRGRDIEIFMRGGSHSRTKEASGQDAVSQAFMAVSTDCETGIR